MKNTPDLRLPSSTNVGMIAGRGDVERLLRELELRDAQRRLDGELLEDESSAVGRSVLRTVAVRELRAAASTTLRVRGVSR